MRVAGFATIAGVKRSVAATLAVTRNMSALMIFASRSMNSDNRGGKIMRRFLVLIGVMSCLATTFGQEKPLLRLDGYWWARQDQANKVTFAFGFAAGATESSAEAKEFFSLLHCKEETQKVANLKSHLDDWNFSSIAAPQLVEGVDEFYRDFRNKGIHVVRAMLYVSAQIRGVPSDELAHRLDGLRKLAAE